MVRWWWLDLGISAYSYFPFRLDITSGNIKPPMSDWVALLRIVENPAAEIAAVTIMLYAT